MTQATHSHNLKPADLRGILEYVPLFRGHCFVISIDGKVVAHENFGNVLTDIAVLASLNIRVILVYGIGHQMQKLADNQGEALSNVRGDGVTDLATLQIAIRASANVHHAFFAGLSGNSLNCVAVNAVTATPKGVLKGESQGFTGRVDKCHMEDVSALMERGLIPVFAPVQFDREGQPLRLNSDELAAELALLFKASKLIYLTAHDGLVVAGEPLLNLSLAELEVLLEKQADALEPTLTSKAVQSARVLNRGTDRAHILDGRIVSGLLTEIFDKVGLGTMIHANAYRQIRRARRKDVPALHSMLKAASQSEALRYQKRQALEAHIDRFYVYEIDGSIVACLSLLPLLPGVSIEVASVLVLPFYQGRGLGRTLLQFAVDTASEMGYRLLVALTTQERDFFERAGGFVEGTTDELSQERLESYLASDRQSVILVKPLT